MDWRDVIAFFFVQVWRQVQTWDILWGKCQSAYLRITKNLHSGNLSQWLSSLFSRLNYNLGIDFVSILCISCQSIPCTRTRKAVSGSAKWWGSVKTTAPLWLGIVHAVSELSTLEENSWDSFWSQTKLVMIKRNWGNSLRIDVEHFLVLLIKSSHKSSQTAINVNTNVVSLSNLSQLQNGINNSMRVVRIRSHDQNCVSIDHWLQMFEIDLVVVVKSGLAHFNIEVKAAFVDCGMNWVRDHTLNKIKLTCWVWFYSSKTFCMHTEP